MSSAAFKFPAAQTPFDRALDDATKFIIMAHEHLANYSEVKSFDPEDAGHEWLFAKRDLRIAAHHLRRAEQALAASTPKQPLRLRRVRRAEDSK